MATEETGEVNSSYAIPTGLSLRGAIQSIFSFYARSAKEDNEAETSVNNIENALDGSNWVRLVRDAPGLASSKRIQRHELDLIFSKAKRPGRRKLLFDDFLTALLELSIILYAEDDPTTAMCILLTKHILGLFDQEPSDKDVFSIVQKELLS
jgi:hypothetical protein